MMTDKEDVSKQLCEAYVKIRPENYTTVGVFLLTVLSTGNFDNQNQTERWQRLPLVITAGIDSELYAAFFCILAHRPLGWRRHLGIF